MVIITISIEDVINGPQEAQPCVLITRVDESRALRRNDTVDAERGHDRRLSSYLRGKCHRGRQCRFVHGRNAKAAGRKPENAKDKGKIFKGVKNRFDDSEDADVR